MDLLELLRSVVEERTPHNRSLGMRLVSGSADEVTCAVPYADSLRGDNDGGSVHSGVLSALLDVTSGAAVFMKLGRVQRMATLGLRIDFLRPSRPGQTLTARAHCFRLTRSTAFVRAFAHDEDAADPIAAAQGTFALGDD
jgi:uncharacterized protein (TIGR00369 family)